MPYKLSYDNITKIKTDAIIIPANVKPVCVPGIMTDVYMAADTDKLLEARNEAGVLKEGEVFGALACQELLAQLRGVHLYDDLIDIRDGRQLS